MEKSNQLTTVSRLFRLPPPVCRVLRLGSCVLNIAPCAFPKNAEQKPQPEDETVVAQSESHPRRTKAKRKSKLSFPYNGAIAGVSSTRWSPTGPRWRSDRCHLSSTARQWLGCDVCLFLADAYLLNQGAALQGISLFPRNGTHTKRKAAAVQEVHSGSGGRGCLRR